jgi:hypothetical protein
MTSEDQRALETSPSRGARTGEFLEASLSFRGGKGAPPETSLLVLDEHPWYSGCDVEAYTGLFRRNLGYLYTQLLDQRDIVELLVQQLFPRLSQMPPFDAVIIPLMSGAVLVKAAMEEFGRRQGAVVASMPISRHPGVCLLRDTQSVRLKTLSSYAYYARSFGPDLARCLALRKGAQRKLRVLLLDQKHHSGQVLLVVMKILDEILFQWSLDYTSAVLVNEFVGEPTVAPSGATKATCPDVWTLESNVNTRSTSHLYYVLGSRFETWQPNQLNETGRGSLHLWNQSDVLQSSVYSMYPAPRLYQHEVEMVDSSEHTEDIEALWRLWSAWDFKSRPVSKRAEQLFRVWG